MHTLIRHLKKYRSVSTWGLAALALVVCGGVLIAWPLPDALKNDPLIPPVRVTDRDGTVLFESQSQSHGRSTALVFSDIPPRAIDALVATEDRTFFTHAGVSLRGILRAALRNFEAGKVVEGGSTITQQLVRNIIQPTMRDFAWKLSEAWYALKLEQCENKQTILTRYFNTAYFGHRAYGLVAASHTYFGKAPHELSLAELALIIGLVQSPSAYDPFTNPSAAISRRAEVLAALADVGKITSDEKSIADSTPLRLAPDRVAIRAPHFVMSVLDNVERKAKNVESSSNDSADTIRTTLDLDLQTDVERIVARELDKLKDKHVTSAAVVVLDAKDGDILTMVGSADYFDTERDGAVNVALAARQPGSSLKPFVYALGLQNGMTAATTLPDVEASFPTADGNPYTPRNYDYTYHGLVRIREALANSYNIAAVRAIERVGVAPLLHFLRDAGVTTLTASPAHYGLALALGDGEVRLLELAQAYAIFARGGETLPIHAILNACSTPSSSRTSEQRERDPRSKNEQSTNAFEESANVAISDDVNILNNCHTRTILDAKTAYLIADILSDNDARIPQFGDDSMLAFDFPVAAKTGTTRNSRDNWTLGFTPTRIVGVWVGNADNTPMKETSGVTGAGPIFHAVMTAAMAGQPKTWLTKPAGITQKEICRISGKLPTNECGATIVEQFVSGTEPREHDDIFKITAIDTRNGLLAGEDCPAAFVTQKTFAIFPLAVATWARGAGYAEPPRTYSPHCPSRVMHAQAVNELTIVQPHDGDSFALDPLIPLTNQKIILTAETPPTYSGLVEWFVDGISIGTAKPSSWRREWEPTLGRHALEARAGNATRRIRIEIVR